MSLTLAYDVSEPPRLALALVFQNDVHVHAHVVHWRVGSEMLTQAWKHFMTMIWPSAGTSASIFYNLAFFYRWSAATRHYYIHIPCSLTCVAVSEMASYSQYYSAGLTIYSSQLTCRAQQKSWQLPALSRIVMRSNKFIITKSFKTVRFLIVIHPS